MPGSVQPLLSVVIVIVSDTTRSRYDTEHLAGTLEALAAQVDAPAMEVLVPYRTPLDGVEELARQHPGVRFLPVSDLRSYRRTAGGREHHDELRARGIEAARGDIVAMLEDHGRPDAHWARRMAAAHREPWAAVGGAIENGIDRPLNWAVYFCDFGRYQNPLPAGESEFASDANICYKRSALESVQGAWQGQYRETEVNWELRSRGQKLALAPDAVVYQQRLGLRLATALAERYIWGRSYAESRCSLISRGKQLALAATSPLIPIVLVSRMARDAFSRRRNFSAFLRSVPITALLACAWSAGEARTYICGGTRLRALEFLQIQPQNGATVDSKLQS
jgi:hypothetical protein